MYRGNVGLMEEQIEHNFEASGFLEWRIKWERPYKVKWKPCPRHL